MRVLDPIDPRSPLERYVAPSDYVVNVCALDSHNSVVKMWSAGSGRLVHEKPLNPQVDYSYFKRHTEWKGFSVVIMDRFAKQRK